MKHKASIRELRLKAGLSQWAVAREIGLTGPSIVIFELYKPPKPEVEEAIRQAIYRLWRKKMEGGSREGPRNDR